MIMLKGRIITGLIWFGFGGLLLYVLPAYQPTFAQLQTMAGPIASIKEHIIPGRFGDSYELFIYIEGYSKPFLLSPSISSYPIYQEAKHNLQVGDLLTIWTTGITSRGGCVDVWQLSKGGQILVPYATMAKGNHDQHTAMLVVIWVFVGGSIAAVRQWMERR